MTTLTSRSQATFVLILVAGDASGREAEVGAVRVLDLDGRAFLRRDVRGIVAFVAGQAGVLTFEQVTGVFMIEGLDVPLDQRKIFSVMLGVAACALLAGTGGDAVSGVQSPARRKTGCDLGVTIQALQCRLSTKLVATGAVGGSVQGLVWAREGSRRNLRGGHRQPHKPAHKQARNEAEPQTA